MTYSVARYEPHEWLELSNAAHKLVFKEGNNPTEEKISYALLAHNDDHMIGYATCREVDDGGVYWKHCGVVDGFKGFNAIKAFNLLFEYCSENYKRISALVKNDNIPCLHLLMKFGFRVIGVRMFAGEILLEMYWEKADAI